MHINFFKDINKNSVNQAGGKGASLGEMTNANIPVPPGFVVLANAFDRFLEETDLNVEIQARLEEVNIDDTNSIDKASAIIRDTIHDHEMPKDLEEEILSSFDELFANTPLHPPAMGDNSQFVAVRSSATAEDGAVASWAGELETYLNTTRKNVVEQVKKCWSSLFTPRAIFYRHEQKLSDHYVSVAVVVQKMIQSEISGIAFTVHPVTEDHDQMIIEAGYGLGEAVVSGQITPDSYVVSKSEMKILDINIAEQTRKLIKNVRTTNEYENTNYEKNIWVELGGEEGNGQKLDEGQILELGRICMNIEKHYGFPCDIEWAFAQNKFYITQSRPITTLK